MASRQIDPESEATQLIQWIRSTAIQLPKLSAMALQSAAFDHYNKGLKDGEPTAAKIAAGLMNLPELDQKTAAARRSEWSRSRCVEYLRFQAATLNKELVEIAEKTKSEAVKVAIVDAIYGAIVTGYPHLKTEAADMAVRRKLELAGNGRKTSAAVMSQAAEPEPSTATPGAPKATLAGVADVELVKRQANQVANLILTCLTTVADYVVPQAQAAGITLDAQAQHAWAVTCFIELARGSKAHWKLPTERSL